MKIYQVFREELDSSYIIYYHNGEVYKRPWFKDWNLKSKKISLGIDQSSTCTGLYLEGESDKILIEFPRNLTDVQTYKKALINELDSLIFNSEVEHFIYEIHNHISTKDSPLYKITEELREYSKAGTFNNSKVKGVLPSVWRKGFLNKEEYKGEYTRDKVKEACLRQTLKENPNFEKYIKYSHKDLDSYEAYGILKGYMTLNYNIEGVRLVNTTMSVLNSRNFKYTIKAVKYENLSKELSQFNIPILLSNNEINLKESCNRVLDEYTECLILFDNSHPEVPRYILETGTYCDEDLIYIVHTKKGGF